MAELLGAPLAAVTSWHLSRGLFPPTSGLDVEVERQQLEVHECIDEYRKPKRVEEMAAGFPPSEQLSCPPSYGPAQHPGHDKRSYQWAETTQYQGDPAAYPNPGNQASQESHRPYRRLPQPSSDHRSGVASGGPLHTAHPVLALSRRPSNRSTGPNDVHPGELHLHSVRMVQRETPIALMELRVAPLVQLSSVSGKTADILRRRTSQASTLVLGARGHTSTAQPFGSITALCGRAACPVVVVDHNETVIRGVTPSGCAAG